MARMHARKRGKSGSTRPASKSIPQWVEFSTKEIEKTILDLNDEDKTQSEIGLILRDNYGVPSTKLITGKRIGEILSDNGVKVEYPEDMMNLIVKAVNLRKHMAKNPKDNHNKRGLELIEAKIKRLVKYYKKTGKIPAEWKYNPEKAAIMVK
ncbi:MAG: 30S ribosomal protein S15 [Candidatus Diapherotrites archaeon]|nr:30S ribosomal protein S15 [Candidatus Diapherotrites archaeon]